MKNKKAISKMSKMIIAMQVVIVVFALGFVFLFTPNLQYPRNNEIISGNVVGFEFKNADSILIDDNPDFSSPQMVDLNELGEIEGEISEDIKLRFEPGTYYWKAVGNIFESKVRSFIIDSEVGLELKKGEDNSTITNVGNVAVNVSEERSGSISGLVILDVQVEHVVNPENNTIYRGEQYDE